MLLMQSFFFTFFLRLFGLLTSYRKILCVCMCACTVVNFLLLHVCQNITPGMKLWGVVAEVNDKDLVVSLPGGLRGLVHASDALDPIFDDKTEVCYQLFCQIPLFCVLLSLHIFLINGSTQFFNYFMLFLFAHQFQLTSLSLSHQVGESFLSNVFCVGQLVPCVVLRLDDDKKEKGTRKIWLSLRLSLLHKNFNLEVVQEGMVCHYSMYGIICN